ncbi:coagulation factor XIII A chain-like [Thunnus albacares]|uniref:coagulation factor XIII A chain-like n=1 Tax=Thunnus albacares TaxID=8236 RepID=UPI001CF69F78|nr:coagulation factor XIII A chain-like [Thunnus albacares]
MSLRTNTSYRGRYNGPVPTSNLLNDAEDFPVFEPFEGGSGAEVAPRSYAPGQGSLSVVDGGVDMCQQVNEPNHQTAAYDTPCLVVRRGQEFLMRVTFNRQLAEGDDFQVEFLIGSNPSASKGSMMVVTFGSRPGGGWAGKILDMQDTTVTLSITPTADAIVGKYRTYVAIDAGSGMQRTARDANTDLYMLFNAWCPADAVFLPDESGRREYVLNDYGVIFQGSVGAVSSRGWMYGQFEQGILDACIYILDSSQMPIYDRGNAIKLVRKGSAMINSQDDNGVLVGNWSDDYSMGTAPTLWTGSVKILLEYANTGVPVCFAQCWVFAGVFNTFLRCLGIPSRVITNFSSAHDNTGNLKTDLIFKPDGTPDRRNTRDSIWNYHCWNEVYMVRPDLPPGLEGWQVVDATPQETSDGHFRCGPASIAAIKEGLLCHPFDSGFVFAEVNSDVVFHKRDRYGTLTPYRVEKAVIGQSICTKAVGSDAAQDITHTYKYPEGSAQDSQVMARAEEYGCQRDHSELSDGEVTVTINCEQVAMGQDVNLIVDFQNLGELPKTVQAHLAGSVVFYTGITANQLQDKDFTVTVPAQQTERVILKTTAQEYLPRLGAQQCLHFILTGQYDAQSLSAIKLVDLQAPALTLEVSGRPQVQQEMFVTVSFTNPFNFPLQNVGLAMEGSGLMNYRTRYYSGIDPQAKISWKEAFYPRLWGTRRLWAVMACSNLHQVFGQADIEISS